MKGWHREPKRHSLASKGIKTRLSRNQSKLLPTKEKPKGYDTHFNKANKICKKYGDHPVDCFEFLTAKEKTALSIGLVDRIVSKDGFFELDVSNWDLITSHLKRSLPKFRSHSTNVVLDMLKTQERVQDKRWKFSTALRKKVEKGEISRQEFFRAENKELKKYKTLTKNFDKKYSKIRKKFMEDVRKYFQG